MKVILAALATALTGHITRMEGIAAGLKANPDGSAASPENVVAAQRLEDLIREDKAALADWSNFEKRVYESPEGVSAVIAERITAGELFEKAKYTADVAAAETKGEKKINDQVAAEKAKAGRVAANRQTITTAHGAVAAEALSEEVLSEENFAPIAAEVSRRVVALKGAGVDPEDKDKKDRFTNLLKIAAMNDEGGKVFDGAIETVREAAGLKPGQVVAAKVRPAHAAASTKPPVTSGGNDNNQSAAQPDSPEVVPAF